MARPAKARLNLEALRNNIAHARTLAPQSKIMAVVKANAYGHGAVVIAQTLQPLADALAVACIDEALELRAAGISVPILLLEGIFEADEVHIAATENLWLCVENEWQLNVLEREVLQQPVQVWLKIDTGMHRLGVAPQFASEAYKRLKSSANVHDKIVLCTHFASADDLQSSQTREQLEVFNKVCETLPGLRSAANSPGLLAWPESHFDWVRPGYMLYGNSPLTVPHDNTAALAPVMTLSSNIISIREIDAGESVGYGATWTAERPSRIATVTIGYGDGYPRVARNGTPVLVNGQRAGLAGRVSMDMITIDVTHLAGVNIGDEVILWGEGLPLAEVAACAGTIGYELTTRMPARTRRLVSNA
jgi:alanine racemase